MAADAKSKHKWFGVQASSKLKPDKLFWLFVIGSVAGFLIEGLWAAFKTGHWEHHAATIWGPFCVIYGIGAVAVYILSYIFQKQNMAVQFTIYMLAGSIAEYFASLLQELIFGSVSWNYSSHFLNIGGRVSLIMALLWGALGILFAKIILPKLDFLLDKLAGKNTKIITLALVIFMAVNLTATSYAVLRWQQRLNNTAADSRIAVVFDHYYGNEKMEYLLPNMIFTGQQYSN